MSVLRQREGLIKFAEIDSAPMRLQALVCGTVLPVQERQNINRHVLVDVSPQVKRTLRELRGAERLNNSQLQAVVATREHVVTLVQGPPGSGKTSVVSALAAVHSVRGHIRSCGS